MAPWVLLQPWPFLGSLAMGVERRDVGAWAPVAGALAGLALPPLGAPLLLWLALVPLWAVAARAQPGQAARGGALWGAAAVLVSHRWLVGLHPLDWIGVPAPLSLPLCLLLLAACAGLGAALVALWSAAAARLDPRRPSSALLLCGSWGLAEVLLAKGPLFWIGLGAVVLPGDRALAGLAQLVGAGGLAALQLALGWLGWRACSGRRPLPWLAAAAAVVMLSHAAGTALLEAWPPDGGRREAVLVLQPAIPTREKFTWIQRQRLQRQLALALQEGVAEGADLVLLPEGALGLEPELPQPAALELISGGFRWQERASSGEERLAQRSALLRFAPGGTTASGWLDKHRLVPLGEWVPLAQLVRWSGLSAVGGVEPGSASRLLARPAGAVAGAICYELADGQALAAAVRQGAGWLLASANLDPYPLQLQRQYAALAQLRAIETGRWLVSSANTGPSLLVDPRGVVRQRLPAGLPARALLAVAPRSDLTGYVRYGDGPLVLLTLGALLGRGWQWWRRGLPARQGR
jgi:apolipoprotein N-acyltransferase